MNPPTPPPPFPYRVALAVGTLFFVSGVFADFLPLRLLGLGPAAEAGLGLAVFAASVLCLYSLPARRAADALFHAVVRVTTPARAGLGEAFRRSLRTKSQGLSLLCIGFAALLAAAVVAIDICISLRYGLLSYPVSYDGLAYVLDARRLFYHLDRLSLPWGILGFPLRGQWAWIWDAMMLGGYRLFGDGDWQPYTARFWPTFLYVLLAMWLVRRRAGSQAAIFAGVATALLPIFSVGLRSSAWEYATGRVLFGTELYLQDLRPDLMFAVFLAWSVALLLETARSPDLRAALASGLAASLAVLTKSSGAFGMFFALGLALLYVFWINRRQWENNAVCAAGVLVGAGPLLRAWFDCGGLAWTVGYLHVTPASAVYIEPHHTPLTYAALYATLAAYQLGHWEVWFVLSGLALAVISQWCQWKGSGTPSPGIRSRSVLHSRGGSVRRHL